MCGDIASVIVNISVDALDRTFDYLIPGRLRDSVQPGTPVLIPFGRGDRQITGYVVDLKNESKWDQLKEIISIQEGEVPVEGQLLSLAAWIKEHYGSLLIGDEAVHDVV